MLTQIHHKQNELFEVEFFKDKECTQLITDWSGYENAEIYIELQNGEIIPLLMLPTEISIYTPYIPEEIKEQLLAIFEKDYSSLYTLDDITPNLSKYILEDNAVLFLSEEDEKKYRDFKRIFITEIKENNLHYYRKWHKGAHMSGYDHPVKGSVFEKCKKLTIFLSHGTQTELQKANEVAKELMEKYGVKEVNLFALHCFQYINEPIFLFFPPFLNEEDCYINKIITTNSTDILEPQNNGRLQVIDCFDILKDYLKENN